MNILLIHNKHRTGNPSGDDVVFANEVMLLKSNGNQCTTYERCNDEFLAARTWEKLIMGIESTWSLKTYRETKKLIRKEKPEVVHIHNLFPLISPSVYYACADEGVPVIQTLHDFRFLCPKAYFMLNGNICERCLEIGLWKAIKYKCFRDSLIQSAGAAFMIWLHRSLKTWSRKVTAYITLTEFAKKKFVKAGFPSSRIFVKPNFFECSPTPDFSHNGYVLFLGRLGEEKGIRILLEAWKNIDVPLKILGDGPLRNEIEELCRKYNLKIVEIMGYKPPNTCLEYLAKARFLILPSVCYEGFPMVIREAFAYGKPVLASRLGALEEIVDDCKTGLLFEPGNPEDLAQKVHWMVNNENAVIEMGENARAEFEMKYTAEKNYEMLMDIYNRAIKIHSENR